MPLCDDIHADGQAAWARGKRKPLCGDAHADGQAARSRGSRVPLSDDTHAGGQAAWSRGRRGRGSTAVGRRDMLNVTVSGRDRVEPLCDIAHAGGQAAPSRDWEVSTAVEGDGIPEAVASIRSRGGAAV